MCKDAGVTVLHRATRTRDIGTAERVGADAVTILGMEAAGHPGQEEVGTMVRIPIACDTVKIPVIAGGGIGDARGFIAALAMGADAVLMGTRFLTAEECPIHPKIRDWLLKSEEIDTVLVNTTHGIPARRIMNRTAQEVLEMEKEGAPLEDIVKVMSGERAYKAWTEGDIDGGAFGCGQVIGLVNEILPAKEIIDKIISEATAIIRRLESLTPKA